jgi:Domain of unknown function (DUF932)
VRSCALTLKLRTCPVEGTGCFREQRIVARSLFKTSKERGDKNQLVPPKKGNTMQHGQLLSHPDDLVTREQLALVETPDATHSFKPIPHIELIETLENVLQMNQITIRKEQFALRRDGSTLFGVLQLAYQDTVDGMAALGLRTSNNRTMSIQLCAGLSVFVCSNMVFRGDLIALNRKHTAGLHLRTEINNAVLRFQDHFGKLTGEINHLKELPLSDSQAKAILHDVFVQGILPIRLLPEASNLYFEPFVDEFRPRNAWSLHNAFTAVAKEMPITTRMPAIQELGRYFGMSSDEPPAEL